MRIGLFGGSFNPAHSGHAHVAETARKALGLHKVWWLVTPQNPLKPKHETAPLAERIAGARRFARGRTMVVTDIETRWGVQFSIDLIERLKRRYPRVRFVWVVGSDNLDNFHRWRRWQKFAHELPIAFVARPGALAHARFAPFARRFAAGRWTGAPNALAVQKPPVWALLSGPLDSNDSSTLRKAGKR